MGCFIYFLSVFVSQVGDRNLVGFDSPLKHLKNFTFKKSVPLAAENTSVLGRKNRRLTAPGPLVAAVVIDLRIIPRVPEVKARAVFAAADFIHLVYDPFFRLVIIGRIF